MMDDDQRLNTRKPKLLRATAITQGPPRIEIACTILDFSDGGARILFGSTSMSPTVSSFKPRYMAKRETSWFESAVSTGWRRVY